MKYKYIGWFFLLPALAAFAYEYFNLNRTMESEKTKFVQGKILDLRARNGYTVFEVEGVRFRMQPLVPCIDQRNKIHDGLEVSIKYKSIPRWPGTFESYGCIIEIEYIGEVQSKRTGRMSLGT